MVFQPTTWRLLMTRAKSGVENMAIDQCLLEMVGNGESPATLRFYAWEPACLSIGYAQAYGDVNEAGLAENGWDVVRRITGGRAILHTDELTYAVITPDSEERTKGDIPGSYRILSQALLQGLSNLGLRVDAKTIVDDHRRNSTRPICFVVPANYEIMADGKKLIGSAQARKQNGVLQHGSLPLYGDLGRITKVLNFDDERTRNKARQELLIRAATFEKVLGSRISWEKTAEAFTEAFSDILNLHLELGEMTDEELERTDELIQEKYSCEDWTKRKY